MRIVLIRCPWIAVSSYPPDIGFAYIATTLKQCGHETLIVDLNIEFYRKIEEADRESLDCCDREFFTEFTKNSFSKYGTMFNEAVKRVLKFDPDVTGFCVWETNKQISLELARKIKAMNPSASPLPKDAIKA